MVHNCFSSYCPDSLEGIYSTLREVAVMTKQGGGTAGYFPLLDLQALKYMGEQLHQGL